MSDLLTYSCFTRSGRGQTEPKGDTMTITSTDITAQVTMALTDVADEYSIPAIVAGIIDQHGRIDIDDIEPAAFWAIVESHEA